MRNELAGRTVFITGGSKGLGKEMAFAFAKEKCIVIISFYSRQEEAEAVVSAIKNENGKAFALRCDTSQNDQIDMAFDNIEKEIGCVDILVNNARIDPFKRKGLTEEEWWDATMDTNLKGAYFCSTRALEGMCARKWGRIVNISSVRAYMPSPSLIPYSISKGGMQNMTRALALQAAPYGVTVNTVAPGMIMTDSIHDRLSDDEIKSEMAPIPLKRAASVEEVADAVVFAASAGFITGETININGGVYMAP